MSDQARRERSAEQLSGQQISQEMSRDQVAEPLPLTELAVAAERWMACFANRIRPYAVQQLDGSYRWAYEDLTAQIVAAHLAGDLTLAVSSTDARGQSRWACLDVDVPGSLPQLLALRDALCELGELNLPGLVVGSRRGGHLWLRLDAPVPATALRFVIQQALDELAGEGVEVPAHELYPDIGAAGALGHAVRLPLGVHRKTGVRYPPYDAAGLPCVFTALERAAAFVLDALPTIPAARIIVPWAAFLAAGGGHAQRERRRRQAAGGSVRAEGAVGAVGPAGHTSETAVTSATSAASAASAPEPSVGGRGEAGRARGDEHGERVGTRSAVIRWVDARISLLDLLADLAPESDLCPVGRGYLGWCPLHDDRAADAAGLPGTPSFYVVCDRRYGWSWRCLSTNCAFHEGPMKHSFRLWQELLGVSAAAAVVEAVHRWPAAGGAVPDDADDAEADDAEAVGKWDGHMDGHTGGGIADGKSDDAGRPGERQVADSG